MIKGRSFLDQASVAPSACSSDRAILISFMEILPFAVAICDMEGKLLFHNHNFINTLPFQSSSKIKDGAQGLSIFDCVCEELASQIQNFEVLTGGQMLEKCDIYGVQYQPSVYFLNDKNEVVLILRDCCDKSINNEEMIERLEAVICENHNMVQQVAHTLGESSAKRVKLLNSFIKSLR